MRHAHGFYGRVNGRKCRHHYHAQARAGAEQFGQQVHAGRPAESQVEKREIEPVFADEAEGRGARGDVRDDVAHRLQGGAKRAPQRGFIVDQQDVHWRHCMTAVGRPAQGFGRAIAKCPTVARIASRGRTVGRSVEISTHGGGPTSGIRSAAAHDMLEAPKSREEILMDLSIWLPVVFVLGLAVLGLMFAFTAACAKV